MTITYIMCNLHSSTTDEDKTMYFANNGDYDAGSLSGLIESIVNHLSDDPFASEAVMFDLENLYTLDDEGNEQHQSNELRIKTENAINGMLAESFSDGVVGAAHIASLWADYYSSRI